VNALRSERERKRIPKTTNSIAARFKRDASLPNPPRREWNSLAAVVRIQKIAGSETRE